MIDPVEFGKQIGGIVREAIAPLLKRIEDLESKNVPAIALTDAEGLADDVVMQLLNSERLRTLADAQAAEAVGEYFKENPVKEGKSVTLDDVSLFLDAAISKHVLDLERRATDAINRAIDKIPTPKDGTDGLGFEDAELVVDGSDALLRFVRGDMVKELRIPLPTMKHIGFWQSGMSAKACETTTHDGSLWLALRDTSEMPSYKSDDWQLAARKGRDGVDGKAPPKSGPVNLKGGDDA